MKNRTVSLLMTIIMSLGMVLGNASYVYAQPDESDSTIEETDNESVNENAQLEEAYMTTGTQQNAMNLETNNDLDIEEDIASLINEDKEVITISTAEELKELARKCKLDIWSANKRVVLEKDILLAGTDFVTIPYFAGEFDGNNHTISGYTITEEQSNIALFAYTHEGALIENINVIANVCPAGKSSIVGGIVSHNSGVVRNCSYKGIVSGCDYVGGIVAINELKGIVADCTMTGYVSGNHATGGIAGENMGNIVRCTNNAGINIEEKNVSKSIEDINIDYYISLFSINGADGTDPEKESMANGIVDTGGIAGLSIGVIQHCSNNGSVGYEKLGYNVGGITGRQSGYINDCVNTATVLGRKDVGGITGQAEPYVTIDFSQDIVVQLSDNISKLHDIIAVTLQDADSHSDVISNRLAVIQNFTNNALDDTGFLADNTVTFVDSVVDEANKVAGRAEFLMDEMSKNDGVFDQMIDASDNMSRVGEELINTIEDFELTQYLSAEEKERLDSDLESSKDAVDIYRSYLNQATNAFTQYYRDKLRAEDKYWSVGYVDDETHVRYTEQNMFPVIDNVLNTGWEKFGYEKTLWSDEKIYEEYKSLSGWKHVAVPEVTDYPAKDGSGQEVLDSSLESDLKSIYGTVISAKATKLADDMFKEVFGSDPKDYFSVTLIDAAELVYEAAMDMGEQVPEDAERTLDYIKRLSQNFKSAFGQTRDTIRTISDMEDIRLPQLGEEYRAHCTSLNNNLQGMSDNFGYLNSEMNDASHGMIGDLSAVNDQFNVIMELYADAIDGVLDKDYSTVIQDDSYLVAEECVDATIVDCVNYGDVQASIDVAGIVGTMAIEYDYDLESDVTGIKDSNMNTTYLTKCVLRQNTNRGRISGQKNYVGGVCGLQEMGIILRCGNYSRVSSVSGDYVGGVAGSSLSDILNSYEKSLIIGKNFVGGIAGKGSDISDCYAIPSIDAQESFGAIAGTTPENAVVRNNFFVNDELAGIDRVSYSKKAEPIEYRDMLARPDVPNDFKSIKIIYVLDDEDENGEKVERTVSSNNYTYGDTISSDMYPLVPFRDGYYSKWEVESVDNLVCDMEIHAEYIRVISTLASNVMLNSGQSQVLVDGQFTEKDQFEATKKNGSGDITEGAIEYWELNIPEDGKPSHMIRYHLPDEYADKEKVTFAIQTLDNGKWLDVETDKMGAYTTFELNGAHPVFQVVVSQNDLSVWYIVAICAAAGILVAGVIMVSVSTKRRKHHK